MPSPQTTLVSKKKRLASSASSPSFSAESREKNHVSRGDPTKDGTPKTKQQKGAREERKGLYGEGLRKTPEGYPQGDQQQSWHRSL